MAKPFSQLKSDMDKLANSFARNANAMLVDVTANAGINAARANPIDTGLSSGNWQANVGSEQAEEMQAFMPTASEARMNQFKKVKVRDGQSTFLINPVPYVRDLNMGSSMQAPPMWIERASEKAIIETIKTTTFKLSEGI